ncbi:MAG TPA: bifunctional UDP-N-acetylglucosamine diphosphorylase/glucosamine-1-phosphate N-acetyltransferase GlmU [Thermoanaerobaculia bacterium]|jgi:bifunctional UDP-N-acetylglucosamine pyrophosphorylase/glucosamine-1-phosphate N-acetyltransferase|nr:bifunctional UDP-N-acetylglucosamine diphosphorylase/glucosamine-1-phosphate N-acetyltransferase GlmU [Thermoanaerobaculia bacterium]
MSQSVPRVAVILAAGKGTRMKSSLPKVLHRAAGRPLLAWVVDAARAAGCERILVVVGHGAEQVREEMTGEGGDGLGWVLQAEQKGTGHALAQAEGEVRGAATVLVLSGDVPLITPATIDRLAVEAESGWGSMAVAELAEPGSLGRVLVDENGEFQKIVEARDASPEELEVKRVNAGLYALPAPEIFDYLRALKADNAQGELYLTDAVTSAAVDGRPVRLVTLDDPDEALGVNDRAELARVHRLLIDRHLTALMKSGVTVLEPARTVIEPGVQVGADTVIHPGASLLGRTRVGAGCTIHQGSWLRDTEIGEGIIIEPYCVLDGAEVGDGCRVGPFARLRPASRLLEGARVGNFVEVKNAELGAGAKVNHLSYVGDATVGEGANLGAGVVTCNYDGVRKNPTEIGPGAFIGSDTMLVAPVKVGAGASTAAGSIITKNVPEGALAVGRVRQKNLEGWAGGLRRRSNPKQDSKKERL